MTDKIEIGEYGRTNYGKIIKFAWIECSKGKRDGSKVVLINEDTLSNDFYYFSIGESIVKHSKQLIDLVEVGDLVYYTIKDLEHSTYIDIVSEHTDARTLEKTLRIRMYKLEELNIKKILTKEQINGSFFEVVE